MFTIPVSVTAALRTLTGGARPIGPEDGVHGHVILICVYISFCTLLSSSSFFSFRFSYLELLIVQIGRALYADLISQLTKFVTLNVTAAIRTLGGCANPAGPKDGVHGLEGT